MQDKNAANTLPAGAKMNTVDGAYLNDVQGFSYPMHSRQKRLEKEKAAGRSILVVEDDASLARLEGEILAAHGYAVAIAGNGELAIAAFRQSIPDLVLLDLELSGRMNGWDVLQALRTHARIPVILTSAKSTVRKQMRSSGEDKSTLDHLAKPYPMQTLLKRIQRMLTIAP